MKNGFGSELGFSACTIIMTIAVCLSLKNVERCLSNIQHAPLTIFPLFICLVRECFTYYPTFQSCFLTLLFGSSFKLTALTVVISFRSTSFFSLMQPLGL
jgi:hypothetical protein